MLPRSQNDNVVGSERTLPIDPDNTRDLSKNRENRRLKIAGLVLMAPGERGNRAGAQCRDFFVVSVANHYIPILPRIGRRFSIQENLKSFTCKGGEKSASVGVLGTILIFVSLI
jgi:hypothetical protein